ALTHNDDNPSQNAPTDVDYTPHPESSLKVSPEREAIVKKITNLYSGSASEEDMLVYAEKAVYDDPWSFCDTRYKIAGQWYGVYSLSSLSLPLLFLLNINSRPISPFSNQHLPTKPFLSTNRHPQSHGLLQNARHRNRPLERHDARLEADAGIYAETATCGEEGR
ncbi:MAG: hypothetical protein L6R38_009642, partial [Xanthoria sp. 2 TBL-2021]